jgi:hypothetical protein
MRELAGRFAALHHLAAILVECVVDDPLGGIERMIILVAEMPEALGDGLKARPFGLMIERVVGIRAVHDPAKQHERRISRELLLLQDRLERAFLSVVAQLDVLDVIRNGVEPLGFRHHLVRGHGR